MLFEIPLHNFVSSANFYNLKTMYLSMPQWKAKHEDFKQRIISIVDTILQIVPQKDEELYLNGQYWEGPLLFLININDIGEYIVSKLEKFSDDTNFCRGISNNNDADILRSNLNKIYQWSSNWLMLFNVNTSSVLHLGYNNKEYDYKLKCKVG